MMIIGRKYLKNINIQAAISECESNKQTKLDINVNKPQIYSMIKIFFNNIFTFVKEINRCKNIIVIKT